jgi:hypothetical protein
MRVWMGKGPCTCRGHAKEPHGEENAQKIENRNDYIRENKESCFQNQTRHVEFHHDYIKGHVHTRRLNIFTARYKTK